MLAGPVALLLIVANASALPHPSNHEPSDARLVTGNIINAIQELSRKIQEVGLDPLIVDEAEEQYVIPSIIDLQVFVKKLKFTGLSNIAINTMNYSVLLNRLRFDLSLPEIYLSFGDSRANVTLYERNLQGELKGQIFIRNIRISGEIRINVSAISGISVRSISLDFSLGGVDSQFNLIISDQDYSNVINTIFNDTIPDLLKKNRARINELLEKIAWEIIARVM